MKGDTYEDIIAQIYNLLVENEINSSLLIDQKINGPDGVRQIDILIKTRAVGVELTTAIECKNYSKIVDVTTVDKFYSILCDLNINKGILISRKGFSNSAKRKARRLGIHLYRVDGIQGIVDQVSAITPIIVHLLNIEKVELEAKVTLLGPRIVFGSDNFIWGKTINQFLSEAFPHVGTRLFTQEFELEELPYYERPWVLDEAGSRVYLDDLKVSMELQNQTRFGYVENLPPHVVKINEHTQESEFIVLNPKEFNVEELFIPLKGSVAQIP